MSEIAICAITQKSEQSKKCQQGFDIVVDIHVSNSRSGKAEHSEEAPSTLI